MRLAKYLAAAIIAGGSAFGIATAAMAGVVDDGTFTISTSASGAQLTTAVPGAVTFATSATFSGYSGSVVTPLATITGGAGNPGGSTDPCSGICAASNYVATYSGNPETISFNAPQRYLGFLWGSVDATNTITFYNGSTQLDSFTGAQLESATTNLAGYPSAASYANFTADSAAGDFTKVVLSESSTYFETTNYAAVSAVPVPAALPMFGAAIAGLTGLAAKRRRAGARA